MAKKSLLLPKERVSARENEDWEKLKEGRAGIARVSALLLLDCSCGGQAPRSPLNAAASSSVVEKAEEKIMMEE
eukprot:scaffold35438_cov155-Skeletonema_dohrnii-CCMP3373.AAC.2